MLSNREKIVLKTLNEVYNHYFDTDGLNPKSNPVVVRAVAEIFAYYDQQNILEVSKKVKKVKKLPYNMFTTS